MDLKTYFQTTKPADRDAFAKKCDTSADYLYLCSRGARLPGPKLCMRIVAQDHRFSLQELRPDIWGMQNETVAA